MVVAVWTPQDKKPQRQPQNPPSRLGACDHWLDFTPELTTSPTHQDALIAQLPTWVWDRNAADPRSASDCGWTYRTSGPYGIEGGKNRLVVVWRLPWYIPIVFPLELCHTDQVDVQEAQILSGQPR